VSCLSNLAPTSLGTQTRAGAGCPSRTDRTCLTVVMSGPVAGCSPSAASVVLQATEITAGFGAPTLAGATIALAAGEVLAVMGPSGSGKSTLLFCVAGLLRPRSGQVHFGGVDIWEISDAARTDLRLRQFGFVFQFGDLVPELTVRENVELPLRFAGIDRVEARSRAIAAIRDLGIEGLEDRRVFEISGGEQQRAAVARATVHRPKVIFADEPTGALDERAGSLVLESLLDAARMNGASVVLVTHDPSVAAHADRTVRVRDGGIFQASGE
jgi:putative ABC transport system ATP-binding protein